MTTATTAGSAGGHFDPSAAEHAAALEVETLSKSFGTLKANDEVSVRVAGGTIHAIVGENGAGKTTLMRMIYGLYSPDAGSIKLRGEVVDFRSPRDALSRGVAMVHQTSLLVGSMTVAENIMLSQTVGTRISRRQLHTRLREIAEQAGLGLDPRVRVDSLSVGQRQRAEILAALYHEASLIILDEPTTVLTPGEAEHLFAVLRDLAGAGAAIILVTHKLREVLAVTDEVTVLRGGRVVGAAQTADLDEPTLVRMMVGRDVPMQTTSAAPPAELAEAADRPPAVLSVENLRVEDSAGVERVSGVSVEGRPGEIVCITGVEGNGQRELVEAMVGMQRSRAGRVRIGGGDLTRASVAKRRRLGMGYIPESRATEGVAADMSVQDNVLLGQHRSREFSRWGIRRMKASREFAERQIEQFAVAAGGPNVAVSTLSGGNAQKVVVAREVAKNPSVLVAVQPTQGVDVAAAHSIRTTLRSLRDAGMCIVLVTSDLREACDLSDRILVLYNGTLAGEVSREHANEVVLGQLAMGLGR